MRAMIMAGLLAVVPAGAVAQADVAETELTYEEWAANFEAGLDKKTGLVTLAQGAVLIDVPEGYYFLNASDSKAVLMDAWGNPENPDTLGMIFPADGAPTDGETWGVELTYSKDGYVSDDDADKINYDKLLKDMQKATRDENGWREEAGYDTVELKGWAEQPTYDPLAHKMYWAKELRFSSAGVDTLNYNVRVLGRRGVFNANFIATMDQLPEIKDAAPDVMAMIEFSNGNRYADYEKGDMKAAYGLAGLVAGGAILKKTGLLAAGLLIFKKFGVVILAGIAGLFGVIKRMFSRNS